MTDEEENEKATSERKEDGEESRKAGRPPMSRIPTFQSSQGRKRVTVQNAESSPKTDGSSQPSQKERAGFTEAGRVKMSLSAGKETALPIPSARLNTNPVDDLSQTDILDHTPTLLAHEKDQCLDQKSEITKDSDQVDVSLQRPPLRNTCEMSGLVVEPVSEFETQNGEVVSEDEHMSAHEAVVEDLSSCSSAEHEASGQDCEETLREDIKKETASQPCWTEENLVAENNGKQCFIPKKEDASIISGQDESAKMQKPIDSQKCFKETEQQIKPAKSTHIKHTKAKTFTSSKVRYLTYFITYNIQNYWSWLHTIVVHPKRI